jgi:PAS domain S-box-containing protein
VIAAIRHFAIKRKSLKRDMEIKIEQFLETNPNPVLSVEKDGTVFYSNEAGEPLLREWGVEIGVKLPSNIVDFLQRVISRNSPERMEIKAGKIVYLLAFHPSSGEERINIYGFDISDQKELEGKLRESEAKYRDVFETVQEVFYIDRLIYDKQGNVVDWIFEDFNPAGFELLGLKDIDEAKGKRGSEVLGREVASFYLPMIEKARRSSKAVTFQYHSPYVDKEFLTSYIIRGDRLISTQMDVTARKQMESALLESEARCKVAEAIESERRRLYDVLETLPVMICLLTADHHVAFANRSFREKFGESRGRHCYEFRFGRTKPCEFCEAYKVLETGQPHKWEVIVSDGSVLEVYNLPFTNVDGSPMILEMDIDITERKKAEEKLKESEEKYRNIVETSNEGIYFVNDEAKVTYANKIMETSGYSLKEIIGRPIWNFISEESLPEAKRNFEKRKQGINESYELKLIRKDGSFIWGFINAKPFFNKKGRFKGYLAMLTDITERKIAEEKLRESEEKYRNIVETADEGIAVLDIEGKHTYVNKKMSDMLGYSEKELTGKFVKDLAKDASFFKKKFEERSRGVSESYEIELIRKDGSPLWALVNAKALFDTNGRFIGSLSMITNITERKLLEEHTRQRIEELTKVLDVAPVAIFIGHDPKSYNITGNQKAYELLETEVGENISASTTSLRRFFCKGRELNADELPMQKASLKNIDVRNVEFDMLLPSGKCRSLLGSASPLHDADMQVRGSVGAFMDITERKQAEEALRNFEIVRHQEIHHRIKNNLQVISSLLDLQAEIFKGRKNISDSEVQNAFKESMDRVISIALIHEELYKGKNTDVINFSQYIKVLAESLLLTYRLDIEVNLDFDLEENFFLDMDTAIPLGIVINEIVSNSFKYAFPGRDRGEIRIKLRREENGECKNEGFKSTTFTLSISDNGIGIPKDLDIEDLDSLGLQLVTTLVDQLDGELELKRDNGTEFTIRFTVTEKENQVSEPAPQQLIE